MTLPSPDDREAVARWLITLRCADDAPQIVLPVDLRVAEEIHRLVRAAVEREREAQEARIAAVLSAVEEIDERIRADGSALCLSEIAPLLDAARAMRRTT